MHCSGCNSEANYALSGEIVTLISHSIPVCHLIHYVGKVCGTGDGNDEGWYAVTVCALSSTFPLPLLLWVCVWVSVFACEYEHK